MQNPKKNVFVNKFQPKIQNMKRICIEEISLIMQHKSSYTIIFLETTTVSLEKKIYNRNF